MTNANDPASPVMQPTGTFPGMTIREQMALTLTAAIISASPGNAQSSPEWSCIKGVQLADLLISKLNSK